MQTYVMNTYNVAIIGGGFSGTMVAVNLARRMASTAAIALIERPENTVGLGVAYGTTDLQHVLNVRTGQIGAFDEEPGHFWAWLRNHPAILKSAGIEKVEESSFVPRLFYGYYLQSILRETCAAHPHLSVVHETIIDMRKMPDSGFELTSATGRILQAKQVVLALGTFPPGEKTAQTAAENPYSPQVWQRLASPGDVLMIGTGLTSLDLLVTLARSKKHGVIHMLSRRGLLPCVHEVPKTYPQFLDNKNLPRTALQLYRTVKVEVRKAAERGIGWQNVIDAMRPLNQKIWENLNEAEQRRFLRFLRPYWDVHRHRCAPDVMTVHDRLRAEGRLILHRGHIVVHNKIGNDVCITWRPRGKIANEQLIVRHLVNCSGPQTDVCRLDDRLVQNLLKRHLITPDHLHLGIATGDGYAVLDNKGWPIDGLYALGILLRGRLFESVAVPELRVQAKRIADSILI